MMAPQIAGTGTIAAPLAALLCATAVAPAREDALPSAAPHVIETTPTLDQRFVPPGESAILARFDVPMSTKGWSWCGSGPRYPEIAATPRFIDDFTAELPVRLKPQHTYFLLINCPSGNNFRSAAGIPAEPYGLRFTTGSLPGDPAQADARNYEAWREFRQLFRERYSYYSRTGTDWEALLDGARAWMLESPEPGEFAVRLAILLERAADVHLYVRLPDGEKVSFYRRPARCNANEQAIRAAFGGWTEHSRAVWSGRDGEVGYLAIRSWSLSDEELDTIDREIAAFAADTRALIIDVRANGGGIETQGRRVAGWFLDATRPYATHRTRDPQHEGGWSPVRTRWVQANPPERRYPGRVFVLQGPVCLSSNEAFLEMMRQSPRTTTIGETSGGSSGNPKPHNLPNGLEIVLPSWESLSVDGVLLEGRGIPPDIEIKGDFRTEDPVLEAAKAEARGEVGGRRDE